MFCVVKLPCFSLGCLEKWFLFQHSPLTTLFYIFYSIKRFLSYFPPVFIWNVKYNFKFGNHSETLPCIDILILPSGLEIPACFAWKSRLQLCKWPWKRMFYFVISWISWFWKKLKKPLTPIHTLLVFGFQGQNPIGWTNVINFKWRDLT